jgi:PIN domain nuclease of toxin-antitoxin system
MGGETELTSLLLDTCATVRAAEGTLSAEATELLNDCFRRDEPVYLSPVTAWELGLLFARGRLRAAISPGECWRRIVSVAGVRLAAMPPEVLMQSSVLPDDILHDPVDRIVAATAREYAMTVMTRDRALLAFARQGYLNAVVC